MSASPTDGCGVSFPRTIGPPSSAASNVSMTFVQRGLDIKRFRRRGVASHVPSSLFGGNSSVDGGVYEGYDLARPVADVSPVAVDAAGFTPREAHGNELSVKPGTRSGPTYAPPLVDDLVQLRKLLVGE
jgi:hypothetical protein